MEQKSYLFGENADEYVTELAKERFSNKAEMQQIVDENAGMSPAAIGLVLCFFFLLFIAVLVPVVGLMRRD